MKIDLTKLEILKEENLSSIGRGRGGICERGTKNFNKIKRIEIISQQFLKGNFRLIVPQGQTICPSEAINRRKATLKI